MEIGIVGKPNVGKSTFFSASTLAPAQIASYPFTTIEPNKGIAYVRSKCPHSEFGLHCTPRNAKCENGTRYIPVELIDVAGLVPDAHKGRGLGNRFMDVLMRADAFIHIVDASGCTDKDGKLCAPGSSDPVEDVEFLEKEISYWIVGILDRGWQKSAKQCELTGAKIETVIHERLTGLAISASDVLSALRQTPLPEKPTKWTSDDMFRLANKIREISKPMLIAANKCDIAHEDNLKRLNDMNRMVIPISAEYELALRRAATAGLIEYELGAADFNITNREKLTEKQLTALSKIKEWLKVAGSTGVQHSLEKCVFDLLKMIVVYPVEDESKLTDKDGRVLPDAYLMRENSTARDLAYKVHTDLGDNFIRAINARTKRVVGQDYKLQNNDIIKIVAR